MTLSATARNLLALCAKATPGPWRVNHLGNVATRDSDRQIVNNVCPAGRMSDEGMANTGLIVACSPDAIAALASGYLEAERDAERLAWLGTRSWFMRALTSDDTPLDPARIDELRQVIDAAIERAAIATRGGG